MSRMKLKFYVVEPLYQVNECVNPLPWTLEGITKVGSSGNIETDAQHMRNGGRCLRVTGGAGAWWNKPMADLETQEAYELAADLYAVDGAKVKMTVCDSAGNATGYTATFDMNGYWQRCRLQFLGAANLTFKIEVVGVSNDFYVDRLSVQKGEGPFTWFCGYGFGSDAKSFRWEGEPMNSRSIHDGLDRRAGRRVDLDDYLIIESAPGLGMADWEQRMTPVMTGGAVYQDFIARPRRFSLVGTMVAGSNKDMNLKRKALSKLLRPDGADGKPINILYQAIDEDTGMPLSEELTLECVCTSAMRDLAQLPTMKRETLDFIKPDPYLYGNFYNGYRAGQTVELTSNNIVMKKQDGTWKALPGLDGEVLCVTQDEKGRIWAGGKFTGKVKYWTGTSWKLPWLKAQGNLDGDVYAIKALPNGDVYIGGNFTKLGTINATRIARLRRLGSDETYTIQQLDSGLNGLVRCLHIDGMGQLVVGGDFTSIVNGSGSNGVARFDPYFNNGVGKWQAYGSILKTGAKVFAICDASHYGNWVALAGSFENSSGTFTNLARLIVDTGTLSSLGAPSTYPTMYGDGVKSICKLRDGSIAYAGRFSFPDTRYANAHDVGKCRGYMNEPFNDQFIVEIWAGASFIGETLDGDVVVFAPIDIHADRVKLGKYAIRRGGTWQRFEDALALTGGDGDCVNTMFITREGDTVYGGLWSTVLRVPPPPDYLPVVTEATAGTYPIIRIFGANRARLAYNRRTGKRISFNGCLIPEKAWFEAQLFPDAIRVMVDHQNRLDLIGAGSDLASFALEPGMNDIVLDLEPYPEDNVTDLNKGEAFVLWQPRFWSLEGATYGALSAE